MDMIDLILVMTVNPGFGGQVFIESQLDKIAALRARIDAHVDAGGQPIDLEVDGGIDRETAPRAITAGANVLVAGTATFRGGPDAYADNIAAMRGGG
jgi:ribulose-phosphate 3-epimerase